MFVNTNVAALNSWLNLDHTQNDMTKVLQQLSSGLKINSAADNPAGLAISQQMQSQISGMNQAYQNSQTAINLFQTADSALSQIQNVLQSMRSLASQAATGTNNTTDLQALQSEMNQYAQQITQITNDTQFNTLNLLGGNFSNESIQVGPNQGQSVTMSIGAADAFSLGVTGLSTNVTNSGTQNVAQAAGLSDGQTINAAGINAGSWTLGATVTPWQVSSVGGAQAADFTSLASSSYNATTSDSVTVKVTAVNASGVATGISVTDTNTGKTTSYTAATAGTFSNVAINGGTFTLNTAGSGTAANDVFTLAIAPTKTVFTATAPSGSTYTSTQDGTINTGQNISISGIGSGSLTFAANSQINTDTTASYTSSYAGGTITAPANVAETTATFTVAQSGSAASTYTNGTGNAVATTGIDITSQADAQSALTVLANAINTISSQRANIGAYQNRLQFASSDLQASSQNLTAAQAQITNADIAMGMSRLTRDQILQQSGVGMLAQANAMPQALLKLIP